MFLILKLISRLPLSFWYFLSDILYLGAKRFYRKKVVYENLRRAFPEKDEAGIKELADDFYKNFCDIVVEQIKTITLSKQELAKRFTLKNPKLPEESDSPHKEILIFALHQANWEWLALGITIATDYPNDPIVAEQRNAFVDQYMKTIRGRFGGKAIPQSSAGRTILKERHLKKSIGILADQVPGRNKSKYWVEFLGVETPFISGITQLPLLTQLPCYFAKFKRVKRGYYEAELIKMGTPPYAKGDLSVLRNYVRESEKNIREHPSQWLWSHKRWKYSRPENEELLIL